MHLVATPPHLMSDFAFPSVITHAFISHLSVAALNWAQCVCQYLEGGLLYSMSGDPVCVDHSNASALVSV